MDPSDWEPDCDQWLIIVVITLAAVGITALILFGN